MMVRRVSVLVSVAGDAVGEVPRGGVLEAEDVGEEEDAGAVVVLDGLEEVRADAVVALADDQVRAPHQLARPSSSTVPLAATSVWLHRTRRPCSCRLRDGQRSLISVWELKSSRQSKENTRAELLVD
jgi:hypothetical protein